MINQKVECYGERREEGAEKRRVGEDKAGGTGAARERKTGGTRKQAECGGYIRSGSAICGGRFSGLLLRIGYGPHGQHGCLFSREQSSRVACLWWRWVVFECRPCDGNHADEGSRAFLVCNFVGLILCQGLCIHV